LEQAVKDYFHANISATSATTQPGASTGGAIERFPVPVGPDSSAITSKLMPEIDARALYAGVQVRVPERRDAGLATLRQLATTPTEVDRKIGVKQSKRVGEDAEQLPNDAIGSPLAHRILAWDHIQHGEFEESFIEIGDAAALSPRDMWVRYYLSVAKYRMAKAKHTEVLGLANMLLDLKAVLEWNPEMASAYDLLAVGRNAGGTTSAAMQSERAAISLSPRDENYTLHLAAIYVSSKKWEAADALLERLKDSADAQVATQARDLLATSGTQRKYGIAGNSPDAKQSELQPQKSPFDVLEQDAAKRTAAENAPSGTADKRATRFVKGRLVAVDCSKAPAAILLVNSGAGVVKLRAADYRSILLIGADDFSCEWRDRQVTANYKPREGMEGDLVSLEMR
jgi:tetratricopeptide (TPR) repeat protein